MRSITQELLELNKEMDALYVRYEALIYVIEHQHSLGIFDISKEFAEAEQLGHLINALHEIQSSWIRIQIIKTKTMNTFGLN